MNSNSRPLMPSKPALTWRLKLKEPHLREWFSQDYRIRWRDTVQDVHVDPGFRMAVKAINYGDEIIWDRLDYKDRVCRTLKAAMRACEEHWQARSDEVIKLEAGTRLSDVPDVNRPKPPPKTKIAPRKGSPLAKPAAQPETPAKPPARAKRPRKPKLELPPIPFIDLEPLSGLDD